MKIILIGIGIVIAIPIVLAILVVLGLQSIGNNARSILEGQDELALSYLKDRYGQEFTIITDGGSAPLGGPITYSPRVTLATDPSVEFGISRCLDGCNPKQNTEFNDHYPYAVWSKQETEALRSDPAAYGIPLGATVSASLYGSPLSKEDRWVLADTNTGVIPFRELPPEPRRAGYTIYLTLGERNPNPTEQDFMKFAETLVGIRNKMREKGIVINGFIASIAPREPLDESGWRFYTHTYTSPYAGRDEQSAEEIATQFKKNTFSDNKLYEQLKKDSDSLLQ